MAKKGSTVRKHKDITTWVNAQPKSGQARSKAALSELRRLFKSPQHDDLCWWHRVGKRMLVLQPKEERRYGSAVVELIADHVKRGRKSGKKLIPNLLYRTRDFAEKYSWREAQKLDRDRRKGLLNPLHVTALVSLDNKGLRDKLLRRCLTEKWSGQRLRREIQIAVGRKRSGGGCKPKPPKNPSPGVALRDISVLAKRWKAYHGVWFTDEKAALKRIPVKDRNEKMLEELGRAADELIEVWDAIDEGLKQLQSLAQELEEAIDARSKKRSVPRKRRNKKSETTTSRPAKGKATKKSSRKRTRQSTR